MSLALKGCGLGVFLFGWSLCKVLRLTGDIESLLLELGGRGEEDVSTVSLPRDSCLMGGRVLSDTGLLVSPDTRFWNPLSEDGDGPGRERLFVLFGFRLLKNDDKAPRRPPDFSLS